MRKYREIGRISLKNQLAYRFDAYMGSLLPFVRVFLAYYLWKTLYTGRDTMGGMTFGMMLTYYIVCAFIQRLDQSNDLVWELAGDIREGRFTKYIVKPVSPLGHFMSVSLGKTACILVFTLLTVVVIALAFDGIFVPPVYSINLIFALLITFMGIIFMILLNYLTALLAFKFTDITGWHLLKGNVVEFLSGALLPLSLLPLWMQDMMRFFPFYYIQYFPASLYLGLKTEEAASGLMVMAIWNLSLWCISEITYKRFRRIYEGVGL